ncbi:MAG TPA: acyl-CoA dehydrogenase [Candidatus Limnocylindria bacterium]|nr:acyl-CoA dehydrogenase [Candidatus Limnocylindria bacterium]
MPTADAPRPLTVDAPEEALFRETVQTFARERVAPRVRAMDEAGRLDPELLRVLFEMGLMGIEIPPALGGAGAGFMASLIAIEELAVVDPSVSVGVDVQNTLVNAALMRWGTREQQRRYLPRLARDTLASYCLSEPGSGSDAFALATRAVPAGDGFRLTGTKMWITGGAEAGLYLLFATVDPAAGYKGITAFLIERDTPGFAVGKREDKLGLRASSTVALHLEDCFVPRDAVLGPVGHGYKIAIETLNEGRIGIGAQMLGLARGAFEHARAYVLERRQFGRRIAEFQGVQFQVAELATRIEAARLLVYNAARLKEAGRPFLTEAAMAKLYASQVAERVASLGVELHGGVGFTTEFPAEKFYRDAKVGSIYEGTSNVQRQTIARQILDLRPA